MSTHRAISSRPPPQGHSFLFFFLDRLMHQSCPMKVRFSSTHHPPVSDWAGGERVAGGWLHALSRLRRVSPRRLRSSANGLKEHGTRGTPRSDQNKPTSHGHVLIKGLGADHGSICRPRLKTAPEPSRQNAHSDTIHFPTKIRPILEEKHIPNQPYLFIIVSMMNNLSHRGLL